MTKVNDGDDNSELDCEALKLRECVVIDKDDDDTAFDLENGKSGWFVLEVTSKDDAVDENDADEDDISNSGRLLL